MVCLCVCMSVLPSFDSFCVWACLHLHRCRLALRALVEAPPSLVGICGWSPTQGWGSRSRAVPGRGLASGGDANAAECTCTREDGGCAMGLNEERLSLLRGSDRTLARTLRSHAHKPRTAVFKLAHPTTQRPPARPARQPPGSRRGPRAPGRRARGAGRWRRACCGPTTRRGARRPRGAPSCTRESCEGRSGLEGDPARRERGRPSDGRTTIHNDAKPDFDPALGAPHSSQPRPITDHPFLRVNICVGIPCEVGPRRGTTPNAARDAPPPHVADAPEAAPALPRRCP